MDPAPRDFEELPLDGELGLPVPFACGTEGVEGGPPSIRALDSRRVVQCALSRVCGVCGRTLGRPIAFIGSSSEDDRNAFHFPPCHLVCAQQLLAAVRDAPVGVLGQPDVVASWMLATTAGYEYVRPGRTDQDRRPRFEPNARLVRGRG